MNTKIKRRLKIYLPVVIATILAVVFVLVFLFMNKVSANDYFKALEKSDYTKHVQVSTIKENDSLIYEKEETIIFGKDGTYHKIIETQVDTVGIEPYITTTEEYYYSKNQMYYLEDNVWKVMDFTLKDNLNRYSLKANYFKSCKFDKDIEKIGKLSGKLNDESVAKALNTEKLKDVELTISVTNNFQVVEFNVKAKTSYNRDATIVNTYTYDEEIVVLPYV